MAVTVGTASLNVASFSVATKKIGSEWVDWENNKLVRKQSVYGLKRVWTLNCYEKNVAWTDSAAKYLREQAEAGSQLSATIDLGDRYNVSNVDVYVDSVKIDMVQVGSQNIRNFTVVLKEV